MLTQNDPFPELDYLFPHRARRSISGSTMMPSMDAYRRGEDVWVHLDLPGVAADSIDVDIERSTLTVTAERHWPGAEGDHFYAHERGQGVLRRQVQLGDALDVENIAATYDNGVLTVRIPVAERAKSRKIEIATSSGSPVEVDTSHD